MKKIKNIILILVIMLLPSLNVKAYDYEITKFDIEMVVNPDNSFDIKETIDTYFYIKKHGIYRILPLKNEVKRLDGTTSTNRAKITNINVNNQYTTYKTGNDFEIRIGNPDYEYTGSSQYVISYRYNIGNDKNKYFDELYYNLVGTRWDDTTISNVTFKITMPKSFDKSKLGFSAGSYGTIGTRKVNYQVNGNVITGSYNGTLNPREGLTIRLELPDGYFIKQNTDIKYLICFIFPIIMLIISGFIWYIYGRDDKVVETIEFYPPEGRNSLEIGFLYKGKANKIDVISLLIYLANKGYIKIQEYQEKKMFFKVDTFKIIKLKEYNGNNKEEKLFLEGLFKKSKTENGIQYVTKDDLYNKFYKTITKILNNVNSKENKNLIYEKKTKLSFIIILFYIISILLSFIPFIDTYTLEIEFICSALPMGAGMYCLAFVITKDNIRIRAKINASCIYISEILAGLSLAVMHLGELPEFIFIFIIGHLSAFGIIIFYTLLDKRNKYGTEILGKIKGFKTFLETAEKDKLESLVLENPTYFYDILPFTYVLRVSDKWIKKFESISMEAPNWYDSNSAFDIIRFNTFIHTTMIVASSTISSSSGGSSGGGSSGGGSGGGGGGSW